MDCYAVLTWLWLSWSVKQTTLESNEKNWNKINIYSRSIVFKWGFGQLSRRRSSVTWLLRMLWIWCLSISKLKNNAQLFCCTALTFVLPAEKKTIQVQANYELLNPWRTLKQTSVTISIFISEQVNYRFVNFVSIFRLIMLTRGMKLSLWFENQKILHRFEKSFSNLVKCSTVQDNKLS